MNSRKAGILGEKIAEIYLKKKGYEILERNYSPDFVSGPIYGEIDIVARKEETISFIEVKTQIIDNRKKQRFFPEDRVDFLKQKKIIKTSRAYLLEKDCSPETKWQIDVLAVAIYPEERKAKVRHIENAVVDMA